MKLDRRQVVNIIVIISMFVIPPPQNGTQVHNCGPEGLSFDKNLKLDHIQTHLPSDLTRILDFNELGLLPNYDRFPQSIFNECGMEKGDAYSSREPALSR